MFWDNVAGVYDVFVDVINRKTHQELKQIVSALIEPEDVILECACGTGLLSAVIAPRCRHLTATDFSEKMLRRAKKNCAAFPNITYAQADITALAYPDGAFDKVVAGNVIHLLDNPMTALGELSRVCKEGGTGRNADPADLYESGRQRKNQRVCIDGGKSRRGFQEEVHPGELQAVFPGCRIRRCAGHAGTGAHPLRRGGHKEGKEREKPFVRHRTDAGDGWTRSRSI